MVQGGFAKSNTRLLGGLYRLLDIVLIFTAFSISGWMFDRPWHLYRVVVAGGVVILFLLTAEFAGVYQSWRLDTLRKEIVSTLLSWGAAVCMLLPAAYLADLHGYYSSRVAITWIILTPVFLVFIRFVLRTILRAMRMNGRNTRTLAFVGCTETTRKLYEQIAHAPWLGFNVVGVYDEREPSRLPASRLPLKGRLQELIEDAKAGRIDYVYITLPMRAESRIIKLIHELADTTASVYMVPDLFVTDLAHARWSSIGNMPVVSVYESPFWGVSGFLKRLEDIAIGALILVLIAPLMVVIAVAIKLTSPGPVFFKQRRYGLNGQVVEVWKFRSMSVCEDGDNVPQAKRTDSRITPLGAFLRRSSLDELPQFINVLQGRMSIVGPRPHAVAHNEQYRRLIHGYMLRHKVKPGITGWAQVNGWRGETDTLDKMQNRVECDLHYVNNWSLWLDLKIIWMTIFKVVNDKNAY